MSRLFGQITPSLPPGRPSRPPGSARKRFAVTRIAACSGRPASSAPSSVTWANASSTIFPPLTSGIDTLPEWFDAEPLHRVDEQLVGARTQRQISLDDILDHVCDLAIGNGGSDQRAEHGALIGAAADRDLVEFLAVLLDAENADMADMVVAAGIDAAGDVDV